MACSVCAVGHCMDALIMQPSWCGLLAVVVLHKSAMFLRDCDGVHTLQAADLASVTVKAVSAADACMCEQKHDVNLSRRWNRLVATGHSAVRCTAFHSATSRLVGYYDQCCKPQHAFGTM